MSNVVWGPVEPTVVKEAAVEMPTPLEQGSAVPKGWGCHRQPPVRELLLRAWEVNAHPDTSSDPPHVTSKPVVL